jgi:MFS family permease
VQRFVKRLTHALGYPDVAELPQWQQSGLRAFWLDGLFAAMATGFTDAYYPLYMLSLRASNAQIGLVNTLSQVAAAALAMPGAAIADRTGRYKLIALVAGIINRLMWVVMLTAPWFGFSAGVWIVIVSWVTIVGAGALGNAAWTALSAEVVPSRLRGGYFASRNMVMQLVALMAIPLAGWLVTTVGEPDGYQINLVFAFVIGSISLYFYAHMPEHVAKTDPDPINTRDLLRRIPQMRPFMYFIVGHATLMLGVMVGAPFLSVYMADERGFSIASIGLVTTVGGLATFISMRVIGRLHERFGILGVMRLGFGVPLAIASWWWVHEPWQGYLVNIMAAFFWAGYNLGAFNLLLAVTPDDHRPRYVAIYTTITAIVSAIGPIGGGWLLDQTNFGTIFMLSAAIRLVGLCILFTFVRESDIKHSL